MTEPFSKQCCWEETNIMPAATQADDHYRSFTLLVSIWSLLELNLLSSLGARVGLWILTRCSSYTTGENLSTETQIICDQIHTFFLFAFLHRRLEDGRVIQNKQGKIKVPNHDTWTWHPCTPFQSALRLQFGSQGCWSLLQLSQGQGKVIWKINNMKKTCWQHMK